MGFEDLILKTSCIAFHVHYNYIFMHLVVCYTRWIACLLVGLDWAEPMMLFTLHVTCLCIFMHTYVTFSIFLYIWIVWSFSECFFLPPHSLVYVNASMAPKRKLAPSQTLCVLRPPLHLLILPLLLFSSVMKMPKRTSRRTFLEEAFIWNTESFWRTSPTLTYSMSFIVGVGSHYVTSRSHVLPCWSKSFTPTCMELILQYLSFILAFKVRALLSHCNLLWMCSMFRG